MGITTALNLQWVVSRTEGIMNKFLAVACVATVALVKGEADADAFYGAYGYGALPYTAGYAGYAGYPYAYGAYPYNYGYAGYPYAHAAYADAFYGVYGYAGYSYASTYRAYSGYAG